MIFLVILGLLLVGVSIFLSVQSYDTASRIAMVLAVVLIVGAGISFFSSNDTSGGSYGSNKPSFTNKYGTSTTRCAHSGCSNYIASSGDTNCCTTHSRKCLNCKCYIDEDAMYCMTCLKNALG